MNYIISDIHNNNEKFNKLLKVINFSESDHLYILGDLFDRSHSDADPVGVYFTVLKLGQQCSVVQGNHDAWLADYILDYYDESERKRKKKEPYLYNSFELMSQRLTPVDMQNIAKYILSWPLQIELDIEGTKYLLAHAQTSLPTEAKPQEYYLMGTADSDTFLATGIEGYVSICGHDNIGDGHIWKNDLNNVYMCDCGCGFASGRLGCLCLETKEEFYV